MGQTLVFLACGLRADHRTGRVRLLGARPGAVGLAPAGPGAEEAGHPETPAAGEATAQRGISHQTRAGLTALGPIPAKSSQHHRQGSVGRCGSYGTAQFVDTASATFGGAQVVSQLRRNPTVRFRNRTLSVQQYFERYPGVPQSIRLRGGKEVIACVSSARL
jgi:hypothetical protein